MSALPPFLRAAASTAPVVLLSTALACATVEMRDDSRPDHGAVALEAIFLEPSIAGLGPRITSLSPDGRWLLLRWQAGAAETEDQVLRLLDLERPAASGFRGTPLDELVRPWHGEDAELERVTWLPEGGRLVAKRGRQVVLFDADEGRTAPLVVEGPPVADGVEDPHRRYAGSIRRLDVITKGKFLDILDDDEAYRLELPLELPDAPFLLDDLEHVSVDLDAAPIGLAFNNDGSIVFGQRRAPRAPDDSQDDDLEEESQDETADEPPRPQILHRTDGRTVVLADFDPSELSSVRMSPDGRFVFGVVTDESAMPEPTLVPDYLTERVTTRSARRQLAENGPEPLRAWIWNTSSGLRTNFFDDEQSRSVWLSSRSWAPQEVDGAPARHLLTTISADHRERTLWLWTEGFLEQVFHDRDEGWIGGPVNGVRWRPEGEGLVLGSENWEGTTTPGRAQLFHVRADDGFTTQLTEVEGEVSDFRFAKDGGLVVTAIRDDPANKWIGWIPHDALAEDPPRSDALRWFPAPDGFNATLRAGSRADHCVFTHERLFEPPEVWSATPDATARLTETVPDDFKAIEWIEPQRIDVTASDGVNLRAHVFVPPDWHAGDAPRATIVFVHGAGYLQNVAESMSEYPLNLMFHSRLAALGYPVIDVDYRGSAGYGRDFRTDVQYHLGGRDLDDIHDVVDHQIERGLVDGERVGLYGGSYGGFMAMMALFTAPERWAAGAALRSVTDWRTYHPRYTQPRLGKPSTHAEAYARSSPIDHVEKLEDPLLVLHGMMDSNVFAQDSIRLIEDLIDLGKDFDAMLYPSQGHGFTDGPHWLDEYRRIERYLVRHLGPPEGGFASRERL